jgi:ubiquinone/menaquinone biosynthesis C-methylase UbiE
LHLFPDTSKALKEISRILVNGGIVTVAAYRNWMKGKFSDRLVQWTARNVFTRVVLLEKALNYLETSAKRVI